MSNTAELCARLLEHAAIHDRETSPYSPEQAAWAADLRDAAALIQAAPVVERADSATPVVERGAGNLSDNAAPVAHAEPASEPAPAPRLRWAEAPRRTEWGAGMMEALIALGADETLLLYAHRDAVPLVDALLSAQPAPARVPLTEAETEWQPIEAAPAYPFAKERWYVDGPRYLLSTGSSVFIGQYGYTERGKGRWQDHYGRICQPTHWMLLPAAPTAQQEPKP